MIHGFGHNRSSVRCSVWSVIWIITSLATTGCMQSAETSDVTTLSSLTYAAVPGDDAPALAHPGSYPIGVKTVQYQYENHPQISLLNFIAGEAPLATRVLSVDILYPANIPADTTADAVYNGAFVTGLADVQGLPDSFQVKGMAVRNAPVKIDEKFPLVIVSHGFMSSPSVMVGLTENLASKGYVVASIDHGDALREGETPLHPFSRAMLNRSLDQQRVLAQLMDATHDKGSDIGQAIDTESIGLIGFSMGGYGVLNHAGAGYNELGEAYDMVPGDLLASQSESNDAFKSLPREHIDAIVTFAPWGAQPSAQIWTDSALANIHTPLLVFGGSQDDISGFEGGILRIFEKAVSADRFLVVFQNALHNLVQVPAPPAAHLDVTAWQTFEDPVWRRERIIAVGVHFTTAFFDWHLKGDESKRSFLELPSLQSNDATWEQPMTSDYSDRFADGTDGSDTYWKGFKRRQAIGLELHHLEPSLEN